jgi:hypothetical protein
MPSIVMDQILYSRFWGASAPAPAPTSAVDDANVVGFDRNASACDIAEPRRASVDIWRGALSDTWASLPHWPRPQSASVVWASPAMKPTATAIDVPELPRLQPATSATNDDKGVGNAPLPPHNEGVTLRRRYSDGDPDPKAAFRRGLAELAGGKSKLSSHGLTGSISIVSVSEISFELLPTYAAFVEENACLGPRTPDDTPAVLLARLGPRPGSVGLWPGSNAEFVSRMAQVHRNMCLSYASRPVNSDHAGVAMQFFRDLPRQHTYVYGVGPEGRLRPAVDVRPTVQLAVNIAPPLKAKEEAILPVIVPWLDRLCPESDGLLRHDVTSEATQAALAIPLLVLRGDHTDGSLTTFRGQQTPEVILWRDMATARVNVVAISQFAERYVMSAEGEETFCRPHAPYCLWAHFSIGRRDAITAPMDLVFHAGNALTQAP